MFKIAVTTIVALMATPLHAGFVRMPVTAYCTQDFNDLEAAFGSFESVDVSRPNDAGVSSVFAENERYTINAMIAPNGITCVTWVLDLGEAG